jgi:hypothetical protein
VPQITHQELCAFCQRFVFNDDGTDLNPATIRSLIKPPCELPDAEPGSFRGPFNGQIRSPGASELRYAPVNDHFSTEHVSGLIGL